MASTDTLLSTPLSKENIPNFYQKFAVTSERFPDRVAIEVQRRVGLQSVTYRELRARAESVAIFLASRGVTAGSTCIILADNDIAWCAAYLGILRLGAIAVPFDTHYNAQQIGTLLRDCGAKILFTTQRYLAASQEALAGKSCSTEIVLLQGTALGKTSLEEFRQPPSSSLPPCSATQKDPAVILYTSGTTSDPKGVVLSHGNLLAEAEAAFQVVHVDENDSILGVLPLFHALAQMANLLLPFLVGARVIFLEELNTAELLRALKERQPTAFCCVPKFFYLIHERVLAEVRKAGWLRASSFRISLGFNRALRRLTGLNLGKLLFRRIHDVFGLRMRLLVTGGARFDTAVGRDLYSLGFSLVEAYGLTESSGAATIAPPGEGGLGSVGFPLPGVEVKICPAEKTERGNSTHGEIAIRGPIVMQGYFNRPSATAETIKDGWLLTGDLGYLGADGRLTITGRKKEVIVLSSGKNIYPEEVEAHYLQSPYIKELCILGLPAPGETGVERLHAVVVPNLDAMRARKVLNMGEIIRFEIEDRSVEDLPRTTTNKLKRYEIERRVRSRQGAAEEQPAPPALISAEDAAWSADPAVARALELVTQAARRKQAVLPNANLELDLGLDSIERVELITSLEFLFGTHIPEEAAQNIYTVRQLVDAARSPEPGAIPSRVTGDPWRKLLSDVPEDDPFFADLLKPHPIFFLLVIVLLRAWRALSELLLGFRVSGVENIPIRAPFLLCPNHQCYLDPLFLVSALPLRTVRELFFVGASEYFDTPFRRAFARLIHLAPVDPDINLVRAMQAGAFGLRHGKILVLFPEGERSIDGEVKKFKKGAVILSLHLQAPIIPVAFDGAFDLWPRNRPFRWSAFLPWKRSRIRLRFGPAMAPAPPAMEGASITQMETIYANQADGLRSAVVEMFQELHRESGT
jgi:long-chain acyl-CoA synthetase